MTAKETERLARLEGRFDTFCEKVEELIHKMDDVAERITRVEEKIQTREEERRTVSNIRIWLIGLTVSTIIAVVSLILRR